MQQLYAILIESQTRTTSSTALLVFGNIFTTLQIKYSWYICIQIVSISTKIAFQQHYVPTLRFFDLVFQQVYMLSVKNKPSILTHLRYFITLEKGNGNVLQSKQKRVLASKASNQSFWLIFKSVKCKKGNSKV